MEKMLEDVLKDCVYAVLDNELVETSFWEQTIELDIRLPIIF